MRSFAWGGHFKINNRRLDESRLERALGLFEWRVEDLNAKVENWNGNVNICGKQKAIWTLLPPTGKEKNQLRQKNSFYFLASKKSITRPDSTQNYFHCYKRCTIIDCYWPFTQPWLTRLCLVLNYVAIPIDKKCDFKKQYGSARLPIY